MFICTTQISRGVHVIKVDSRHRNTQLSPLAAETSHPLRRGESCSSAQQAGACMHDFPLSWTTLALLFMHLMSVTAIYSSRSRIAAERGLSGGSSHLYCYTDSSDLLKWGSMEQVWIINILPGVDSTLNALVCRNTKSELIDSLMACLNESQLQYGCTRPKTNSACKTYSK